MFYKFGDTIQATQFNKLIQEDKIKNFRILPTSSPISCGPLGFTALWESDGVEYKSYQRWMSNIITIEAAHKIVVHTK